MGKIRYKGEATLVAKAVDCEAAADAAHAIHPAATDLIGISVDGLDQQAVREMKPLINSLMETLIAVYRAERGLAKCSDFNRAKSYIGQVGKGNGGK
ncbi:type I toxin-antitoxin system ptaRNA1 family toxin [Halopseudomonas sp.]|uniref:type I toxin-antitoxin system ptaRNA1 family toxin n=1 Tax=Halopseudomonas sp. TaxID=2901191 RepID=UPI0030027ABC